jgi:hypothetical protein
VLDFYVQVLASGDFSKLNIHAGDSGGELDPHGAQGAGNPIGGNVTTTVTPNGSQLNVGEWMQFISSNQYVPEISSLRGSLSIKLGYASGLARMQTLPSTPHPCANTNWTRWVASKYYIQSMRLQIAHNISRFVMVILVID